MTESDEAFGIILLDNNAEKYESMIQYENIKQKREMPKYFRRNMTGKCNGKGWSYVAINKYFKMQLENGGMKMRIEWWN